MSTEKGLMVLDMIFELTTKTQRLTSILRNARAQGRDVTEIEVNSASEIAKSKLDSLKKALDE